MSVPNPLVFVVVPTYDEADNLPLLARALLSLPVPRLNVLVVDDNSPDGTGHLADALSARFSRLHVIHRPVKAGLGAAYREGFQCALAQGADYIVQMDADFSHAPETIPQFLRLVTKFDVVVGSRYTQGGSVDPGWSWWRNALSRWANSLYVRLILGLEVRDATAGFKCWSRDALLAVLDENVASSGYVFQVEMAFVTERLGFRVFELPIHFEDRRIGKSKLSWAVKFEAMWRTWLLPWQYRHLNSAARHRSTSNPRELYGR